MDFTPSQFQESIFEFVRTGTGNAVIQAVAGSGKTTTIVKAMEFTTGDVVFCAFNKAIVNELEKRAPKHARVSTLHSIGYSIIRRNLPVRTTVDGDKMRNIVRAVLEAENESASGIAGAVDKMVGLVQNCLLDGTVADLDWLMDRYSVEVPVYVSLEDLSRWVMAALRRSAEMAEKGVISFDDMVYLPAKNLRDGKWLAPKHDWVFVDEAQDLTTAQLVIVEHILAKDGRLIAVGDENQAIYGFRGADVESMVKLREHFHAVTLPLSVCYRCPKSHVALARDITAGIQAAEWAIEGTITELRTDDLAKSVHSGDLVICRRNAPIVKSALQVIATGKKATVRGRDIGTGLVNLVKKMKCYAVTDLLTKLDNWVTREVNRLREAEKEVQAQSLEDRSECIAVLAEGLEFTSELVTRIESVFSDAEEGVIFSSVHRAKGLEADNVYILEFSRMPLRWKTQSDWQYRQELNIKYVAVTRAKKALFLVGVPRGE